MATAGVLRLRVHLQPGASRDRILGRYGDAIKIQIHAPPTDGAANAALIALLAGALAVPRAAIRIAHGVHSRRKLIEVRCSDPAECHRRLEAVLPNSALTK